MPWLKKEPLSLGLSHWNYSRRWDYRPCPPLTRSLLELSTVCDSDPLGGSPRPGTKRLHFLDHFHSFRHAAKDNMLAIQPKWTKRRFIIGPGHWDNPWCTQLGLTHGFLLAVVCNDSAILGHHSNHPFFFLLCGQNITRIHCFHQEFYSQQSGGKKNPETALQK